MRTAARRASTCWSLCLLVVSPALARAQTTPQAEPARDDAARPARLAEARDHFRLGMQLYDARNFREALREFELVDRLAPSAELWFNIGRAHEELGEYDRAARALERYLRDRVDASDAADVRARIKELDSLATRQRERAQSAPDNGSLRIHGRTAGARVLLDGQRIRADLLEEPLLLASGSHQLDVIEPSYIPLHAQIAIEPGLLTAAYVDLTPATRARTQPSSHAFTWTLLGLSAAGAITSGVLAALAISEQHGGDVSRAEAWALRTDVALAGTAVCALAAVLLYYIEGRSARTELSHPRARPAARLSSAPARSTLARAR
jgi:hypothetical protein